MRHKMTVIGTGLAVSLTAAAGLATIAIHAPAHAAIAPAAAKMQLASAGALAFGPPGILFIGDTVGASVVAIDTGDTKAPSSAVKINIQGLDSKIAALVGVTPDQIVINDMKVNPVSKNLYVSASRGRGPDAMPLIIRIDASGKITPIALDSVKFAAVSLVDAPAPTPAGQPANPRRDPRLQTITDMNYVGGNLMVAGLSNEEWSSALRSIPYPFKTAAQGATLQIWHSSHGRFETEAPVRTFVPYTIAGKDYILAAYTCTPLVKIPVADLKPGAKIKGVEIADLGAGNQPLDMVAYQKDGHDYILVANTSLGVTKLRADNLETYPEIASPTKTDVAGVPYDKIASLTNVVHLARLDNMNVLVMSANPAASGSVNVTTIALP